MISHFRYRQTLGSIFILGILLFLFPSSILATGSVSGIILGPHGETAGVNYSFTQGGTTVTGTTNSSGVFSQSLADGDWSFTATPPSTFEYADNFTIPVIRIANGDSFDLGTMQFVFEVPAGADSDLEEFAQVPVICSQTGTPVIFRAYYEDAQKGSFLYEGRSANVIVVADRTDYTVQVDYSMLEGDYNATNFSNSNTKTASHQGNGVYKATHTIALATEGGGMPLIKVTTSGGGSSTYKCLDGGPVNLDIRSFFSGSDTTDFTSVTDFRSITNFTMHENNVVKVRFTRAVNMLDPTVQRFMKSIAAKMVTRNSFLNFDAAAVLELKNAGAEITFYNIDLSSPKILVDGVENSSVATGITYTKSTKTLVFSAAHFTTFTVIEGASSSSSSSSASPPGCSALSPEHAPHLFQIDATATTATLYFTPLLKNVTYYYIAYGFKGYEERFGTTFSRGGDPGVISYTINELSPNTAYDFKVRAGNGCAPGAWSNTMEVKTDGGISYSPVSFKSRARNAESASETVKPSDKQSSTQTDTSSPETPAPLSDQNSVNESQSFWHRFISFFFNLFQ